jgi:hypothetical protein
MYSYYDKAPSRAQLRYLKNLGYVHSPPDSMAEASAAIDEMLASGSSAAAHREILKERQEREGLFGPDDSDDPADFVNSHPSTSRRKNEPSFFVLILLAPVMLFAHFAAAVFWSISRIIAFVG